MTQCCCFLNRFKHCRLSKLEKDSLGMTEDTGMFTPFVYIVSCSNSSKMN